MLENLVIKELSMIKYFKGILILFFASIVFSCATTPVSITSSNTPLNNKKITENLGKVEGEGNLAVSVFGLWMLSQAGYTERH